MFLSLDVLEDSVLAVVDSASLKTGVHVSFQVLMFSRSEPRSGVSGTHGPSADFLKETSILFSIVAAPCASPLRV